MFLFRIFACAASIRGAASIRVYIFRPEKQKKKFHEIAGCCCVAGPIFSAPTLYIVYYPVMYKTPPPRCICCNTVVAAFSDGRHESLSCNQSGCAAYNRVRLLLRFELYKTPKSGGAASIRSSAYTRHNTVHITTD